MRLLRLLCTVGLLSALVAAPSAQAADHCMLVLGAMPVEIGPFLANATGVTRSVFTTDGGNEVKSFFTGTLQHHDVVIAMTGIGTVNALETAHLAFDKFPCIDDVMFSGVSGAVGDESIGDVLVPSSWKLSLWDSSGLGDAGTYAADANLLIAASDAAQHVTLSQQGNIGDCGCAGIDPASTPSITFPAVPKITIGGSLTGHSSDPFGGNPLPCTPGTDTFGCQPCKWESASGFDFAGTPAMAAPFATPQFLLWYQAWSAGENGTFNVEDMETAAVAKVAHEYQKPFIGFRSPSDGTANGAPFVTVSSPLSFLPQFALYRQYASDHAAQVALEFLARWHAA